MTARAPRVGSPAETTAELQGLGGPSQIIDTEVRPKPRPSRKRPPTAVAKTRARAVTISTPLLDEPYVHSPIAGAQTHSGHDADDAGIDRPAPSYPPTNAFAIISLVLGIVWLGGLGSLLAVIFGFAARSQMEQRNEGGHGMALAGIVLGIAGLLVLLALVITVPSLRDAASKVAP